ncbi:hypothetical protein BGX31_010540, partial [Mortierella sp. GBA43]
MEQSVMKGSKGSNGLNKEAWKDEIDAARDGAGYFLAFKGKPEFKPLEYVSFRGLSLSEARRLLPTEWLRWIQDLKTSPSEHVRRRAVSAPALTAFDITDLYKSRNIDSHELEILEESSQQVINGGQEPGSLLQGRQSSHQDHSVVNAIAQGTNPTENTIKETESSFQAKGRSVISDQGDSDSDDNRVDVRLPTVEFDREERPPSPSHRSKEASNRQDHLDIDAITPDGVSSNQAATRISAQASSSSSTISTLNQKRKRTAIDGNQASTTITLPTESQLKSRKE